MSDLGSLGQNVTGWTRIGEVRRG